MVSGCGDISLWRALKQLLEEQAWETSHQLSLWGTYPCFVHKTPTQTENMTFTASKLCGAQYNMLHSDSLCSRSVGFTPEAFKPRTCEQLSGIWLKEWELFQVTVVKKWSESPGIQWRPCSYQQREGSRGVWMWMSNQSFNIPPELLHFYFCIGVVL